MKSDVFITSGFLPVPATKGGAVESLVQNLINENEIKNEKKFVVFSIYDEAAKEISNNYKNTKFIFYKPNFIIKFIDMIFYFILTILLRREKKTAYRFITQRLFYINFVSKNIRKNNYNSIIVENNATLFLSLKLRKNYIKYKGRYFFHLHNDITNFYGCKSIIENCKRIITVSQFISNIVEEKINYNPKNIMVLKNCIDMKKFNNNYGDIELKKIKEQLNIDNDDKIIVFVGRTIKEKGILEVVKAFNKCNIKKWTLLIVGSSGFDIKVKSDFEKNLQKETKDNKKIKFTGFVQYEKLGAYYALADLAVLPSIWDEPAGLTMLEAIASGTPLITTNSGGIPEYAKDYNAVLLDVDDNLVNNISDKMRDILINKIESNTKNAMNCQKEYNLEVYLEGFVECIK